jgi:hypothetical protein
MNILSTYKPSLGDICIQIDDIIPQITYESAFFFILFSQIK